MVVGAGEDPAAAARHVLRADGALEVVGEEAQGECALLRHGGTPGRRPLVVRRGGGLFLVRRPCRRPERRRQGPLVDRHAQVDPLPLALGALLGEFGAPREVERRVRVSELVGRSPLRQCVGEPEVTGVDGQREESLEIRGVSPPAAKRTRPLIQAPFILRFPTLLLEVRSAGYLGNYFVVTPGRCNLERRHSLGILLVYVASRMFCYDLRNRCIAHTSGYM